MAAVRAGHPYIPTAYVGIAVDPSDITGSVEELGMARRCRRSDGGWYSEVCCYASEAHTQYLAARLDASLTITQNPTALTFATGALTGEDAGADDVIVIPQQTIAAAGYYWFAYAGVCEAMAITAVTAGDHIEWLHDGGAGVAGEFSTATTTYHGTAAVPIEAAGFAIDPGVDSTASTIFLYGRAVAIKTA